MKTTNPQIIRWYNMLTEFDFTLKYKPGEQLAHTDALSRASLEDEIYDDGADAVTLYQYTDERLRTKIDILRKQKPSVVEQSEILV